MFKEVRFLCLLLAFLFKFCVGFLVTNCRDLGCLRHSANLSNLGVSGIRPLLLHVLVFAISRAFLTVKLLS